ncbi:NKAP-like protein [Trifolium pratense]|uniref:NKAP-like protein n=1 Tax=Trifolium pratense TaxID=57577 RepID=UPI001E69397A|nr:NKAP-like protein [Trifolium pratense]
MDACVEGSKRQLPSWMMPPMVGASNVSNNGNVVETNCSKENKDIIAANVKKNDHKKETLKRKLNSNVKCEVMGKINLDQQNESDDNNNIAEKKKKVNSSRGRAPRRSTKKRENLEDHSRGSSESDDNIAEKKKKKVNSSRGRAPRRSTKKRGNLEDHSRGSSDCDHVCPVQAASDDDDMELTVEDLMAIAEQYVKDSEDKEPQETTSRWCEQKWQFPAITEVGTTLDSSCENKKSYSMEREALCNSAPSPTTDEVIPASTSQIGYPAQDMLDVFLGPLLRNL